MAGQQQRWFKGLVRGLGGLIAPARPTVPPPAAAPVEAEPPAPPPDPVPEPEPAPRTPFELACRHAAAGEAEAALAPLEQTLLELDGLESCAPLIVKLHALLRLGHVHQAANIHRYVGLTWDPAVIARSLESVEAERRGLLAGDPDLAPVLALDWEALGARELAGRVARADSQPVPPFPYACAGDRPLVVVRMTGGLGNQLFQYAAALAWARRCGADFHAEISSFNAEHRDHAREHDGYWLDQMETALPHATAADLERLRDRHHVQDMRSLDRIFLGGSGDVHLFGYWGSHLYFEPVAAEVARTLQPKSRLLRQYVRDYIASIRQPGSDVVALHVRRGDNKWIGNRNKYKVMHPEFYRRAAALFPDGTTFLVFSDTTLDVEWCKQNIDLGPRYRTFFSELHSTLFDFYLMRECDHAVISNSTFSWWAAWLIENPRKVVIAPAFEQSAGPLYAHLSHDGRTPSDWRTLTLPHEYVLSWK